MNTQYYRVTAYHPAKDLSIIMDSNGLYDALWKFSSSLVNKGFEIFEVGSSDKFLDVNINKVEPDSDKYILRAICTGKPQTFMQAVDGKLYHVLQVKEKIYIPDKTKYQSMEGLE